MSSWLVLDPIPSPCFVPVMPTRCVGEFCSFGHDCALYVYDSSHQSKVALVFWQPKVGFPYKGKMSKGGLKNRNQNNNNDSKASSDSEMDRWLHIGSQGLDQEEKKGLATFHSTCEHNILVSGLLELRTKMGGCKQRLRWNGKPFFGHTQGDRQIEFMDKPSKESDSTKWREFESIFNWGD